MPTKPIASLYDESAITALKGLEPVQRRPGMYTRVETPNHIIQEVVDNAQDEALAGHCTRISVELMEDGSISVEDNGRGIPVGIHPTEKISTLAVVFTVLHAGGKFDKKEGSSYLFSGGLHGVGVSVTNALSDRVEVTVWRDGQEHNIVFEKGLVTKKLVSTKLPRAEKDRTGTRVRAWPTASYFEGPLNVAEMERYLRSKAVLLQTTEITWTRPGQPPQIWHFPGGLTQYLTEQVHEDESTWVAPPFTVSKFHEESDGSFIAGEGFELALGWNLVGRTIRESYVNLIHTDGGRHETGMRSGLLEAFRVSADRLALVPKGLHLESEDITGSLSFILSAKLADPQFAGQTKDRMTSEKGHRLVAPMVRDSVELWLNDNPQSARALILAAVDNALRRSKSSSKAERKRSVGTSMLPGKLADCQSRDVSCTELFLVEGDSAGGCFVGETMIQLANGKSISFLNMVKEQALGIRHFGFSTNFVGHVVIEELLHARLTQKNARLIRVSFDNGCQEVCTPDHLFRMRDGSYKKAENLCSSDSLMALYEKKSEKGVDPIVGYSKVMNPATGRWRYAHILADEYNLRNGFNSFDGAYHRHHADFNKLNNYPDNIIPMLPENHLALHRSMIAEVRCRPEVIEKLKKTKSSAEFRQKMSLRMFRPDTVAILSAQAKKQWENSEYKEYMAASWLRFYNENPEYRLKNNAALDEAQKKYWSSDENRARQSRERTDFYAANPEYAIRASNLAVEQWSDENLLVWRSAKTSEQWKCEDFRKKRKAAMEKNYFERGMACARQVFDKDHSITIDAYEVKRKSLCDRYVMKFDKFVNRFFNGDIGLFSSAVETFNHKVVNVEYLDILADVYDLEAPENHNFALASGVFVHNSSKEGRDRVTQAILPLRGKLLNTWEVDSRKALQSETISNIASAIGVDPHPNQKAAQVDLSGLRYGKIFIMADADVDGSHIQVLLLSLFLRHFPALIERGHIWIARAPLFRIDAPAPRGHKGAPRKLYALDEPERESTVAQLVAEGVNPAQVVVSRFKGLGEMNPEQLGETTMNKENRRAILITLEDAERAHLAFDRMMGKKFSKERRDWMEADGHLVEMD